MVVCVATIAKVTMKTTTNENVDGDDEHNYIGRQQRRR